MALSTSEIILKNMVRDSGYTSRVLPFLKPEYFERKEEKVLYNHIAGYIEKYKSNPTIEALYISLAEDKKINEKEADGIDSLIKTIKEDAEESKIDWLIDTTEKFCQERALHNAVYETIQIIEGETKLGKGAIPDILKEALAVSFDTSLGQDYFDDAEARYEYYHQKEVKFPFDIDYFNRATKDGFARKTLNLLLSGSGVGKTAVMVHMAASNIKLGQNVMYFTMEISEKEIFKRVDANLLDLTIDDVVTIPKEMYLNKINKLKLKTPGVLKVKEYPMGAAHVGHFRAHLNELKLKQNFKPDIIYVDYLGICASMRLAGHSAANSYSLLMSISQELRGLATEMDVAIVSAHQLNRGGGDNSDPSSSDIADSFGILFGLDLLWALVVNDELKARNQMLVKQLKSRYDDISKVPKFMVGFDRGKQKLFNLEDPTSGISSDVTYDKQVQDFHADKKPDGNGYKGFQF